MPADSTDLELAERVAADIRRALRRVAAKHGLHCPETPVVSNALGIMANVTLLREEPDRVYATLYRERARALGLEDAWLGAGFFNPHSGRDLVVVGLDPDGGEQCVRVRDAEGNDLHLHPGVVRRLIADAGGDPRNTSP
ncbi:hypothetical protein J2T57_001286 [Natronocella acetinitrilica]|uniref:Uncharacterized protein n=1 Tax=Natronocella acetinitrilica TaxID=414046 RepID=A0AAE3G239_9GAMM|nr:hypothetical protein [Natronocella acetinitrilica]MCP1674184.1 hypothetical protein [Natronocella acetinitrilica]